MHALRDALIVILVSRWHPTAPLGLFVSLELGLYCSHARHGRNTASFCGGRYLS